MNEVKYAQPGIITGALASNPAKVLRNTYLLLSMTLLFSAVTASVAMALGLPRGGALLLTLVSFGLLFWVRRTEDSSMGIVAVFAFTGCMGAALGPMLSFYLAMQQGPTIVMQALGGTALVFLTLFLREMGATSLVSIAITTLIVASSVNAWWSMWVSPIIGYSSLAAYLFLLRMSRWQNKKSLI